MKGLALSMIMLFPTLSSAGYSDYRGTSDWGSMLLNGKIFMVLLWILFLILLLILVYGLVKGKKANLLDWPSGDTPLDILKRRYAKGEITKEEFDRIKNDLT